MEGATYNACKQIYQGCYFQYHLFDNIVDHVKLQKPRAGRKHFSRRRLIMPLLHLWVLWNKSRTWKIISFNMDLIGQREDKFLLVSGTNIPFLHTLHGGMLRGRWEFSSQRITIWWVWNQVPTRRWSTQVLYCNHEDGNEMSKTNNSVKLFGRVGRHIDPSICSFGTQWFWLM